MDIGEWMVEVWNRSHSIGTEVELTDDFGKVEITKTRSNAWQLGSGDAVIKVEGRTGGYLLDRILPLGG